MQPLMAVNEINNAGGIYVSGWNTKVNITLVTANTINDAPSQRRNTSSSSSESDKVDMLIGGYGSAGTLANEVVAIENKVPYIITGASNQLVTRRGPQGDYGGFGPTGANSISDAEGMSYMFHYCTTTYDYAKQSLTFLAQRNETDGCTRPKLQLSTLSTAMILLETQLTKQQNTGYKTKAYQSIS